MEGELKNLIKVWLIVLASLCYTYFIASKIPKGKLRLLSLIPIFSLFTILPLPLTTVLPTGITAFFITWLANFKLLLFSFGLGPLSSDPPKSLPLFISIACFPIKIKQNDKYPSHQNTQKHINSSPILEAPPKLPLNFPTKVLLFAVLVAAVDYKRLHPKIVLGSYCCLLYFLVDIVLGLCNAIVRATLGIELELPSDEPYLSTSLQDFWGRRWNLMVTNILRHTIYKPVRSISETVFDKLKQQKQKWAPLPAVLVTFIVSALMHELIFFYITRVNPTWEVTCFFVLHGVCLVVEFWVKNVLLARGCWLHWAVAGPLTIGFVVVTANWLFLPPLVRNGADIKAIEGCKVVMKLLKDKMLWTLKSL